MKIVFVKSHLLGSRLIRWFTGENVSHVAVVFDGMDTVVHSYGFGVAEMSLYDFAKRYEVVHTIPVGVSLRDEVAIHELVAVYSQEARYDFLALLYFGWRAILNKFLALPYPERNRLEDPQKFMCTEAVYLTLEAYTVVMGHLVLPRRAISMMTPKMLYHELREAFR